MQYHDNFPYLRFAIREIQIEIKNKKRFCDAKFHINDFQVSTNLNYSMFDELIYYNLFPSLQKNRYFPCSVFTCFTVTIKNIILKGA